MRTLISFGLMDSIYVIVNVVILKFLPAMWTWNHILTSFSMKRPHVVPETILLIHLIWEQWSCFAFYSYPKFGGGLKYYSMQTPLN